MITVAKYTSYSDAHTNADRITSRGIRVIVEEFGTGDGLNYDEPFYKLQLTKEDLPQFEAIKEELQKEIRNDRLYACPTCNSKNYRNIEKATMWKRLIIFATGRSQFWSGFLRFQCSNCNAYFKFKPIKMQNKSQ